MRHTTIGYTLIFLPVALFVIMLVAGIAGYTDGNEFTMYMNNGHGCFESARYVRDITPVHYRFNSTKKITDNTYTQRYLYCLATLPVPFFYGPWWPVTAVVFIGGCVLVFWKKPSESEPRGPNTEDTI